MRSIPLAILLLIFVSPVIQGQDQPGDKIAKLSERANLRGFPLKHARVENVAPILNEQFPPGKFSGDTQTNTIYAKLSSVQIPMFLEFIDQLERSALEAKERERIAEKESEKGERLLTRTIPLKHVDAVEMEAALTKIGLAESGSVAAGPSGNVIVLRLPEDRIQYVAQVVERLDTPPNVLALRDNEPSDEKPDRIVYKDLTPLMVEHQQLKSVYGPEHPKVKQLEKRIAILRRINSRVLLGPHVAEVEPQKSKEIDPIHSGLSKAIAELREGKLEKLPEEELKKIQNGISEQVGQLFDLRQKTEESQWEKANDQLNEIRERLDVRKKNREAIIQKRVDQLLADED